MAILGLVSRLASLGLGTLGAVSSVGRVLSPGFSILHSWLARGALIVAICGVSWFGFARHYEKKGEIKIVQRSEKAGEAANETNDKVRSASRKPGSFDRLLKDSCSDC